MRSITIILCVYIPIVSQKPRVRISPDFFNDDRGSILLWWRCDMLRTSGIVDDIIIFTAQCYASAVYTSHGPVSVRLSVHPSVEVLLKRLNVGSHKQHRTIAQGL